MFTAFKQYLLSLKLSPVSRKLYLSDIRRFLANFSSEPTLDQLSSSTSYLAYLDLLRSQAIAPSMLKRTIASLRQFGSFFALTYSLPNPMINLHQASLQSSNEASTLNLDYIKHFTNYLNTEHLSPLTIKSYKSDITRYLDWVSTHTASNKMDEVLNDKNIKLYLNHLSESGATLPSTIERKEKSIARMSTWYAKVYPATSITDNNTNAPRRGEVISPAIFDIQTPSTLSSVLDHSQLSPDLTSNFVKTFNYRTALAFVVLTIFASALAIFGYRQFSSDAKLIAAYPNTPVTPNRQLSFQGRLENASGTPITTATNLTFKLFNAVSGPTELYSTGACSITPDADGVFSTQIGSTCGTGIPATVFTENSNIWLEVTVVAEILTPRQAIASVAYALNSETIQGFPISSTVSAIRNTVVPMNQWGEIVVGEQSPRLTGVSGTFQISAPSISITTATGTNGNITIAPDGTGQVNVNGNTTSTNFFNVANAQLTTGSLITGTAANNNTGFKLIDLLSGSSPTSKFSVTDTGNTTMAGDLTVTGDDLFMNTNTSGYMLVADGTNYNPVAISGDITIGSTGVTAIGADRITESMLKSVNGPTDEMCLTYESTVGDFEWQTCGSSSGSSNWRIDSGAISPLNDTLDLLVGGIATSSAKAGFININSGTPTATLSAGVTGGAFLTANGYLSTTARQSLTLGNSTTYDTTGNILLNPNGTGNVGIGTTTPDHKLDIGEFGSALVDSNDILAINIGNNAYRGIFMGGAPTSEAYSNVGGLVQTYFNNTRGSEYAILSLGTKGYGGVANTLNIKNSNVGIGTTDPSASLHVVNTAGTLPTLGGTQSMILQRNSAVGNWNSLDIISGTTGGSSVNFGDSGDEDIGSIQYNHNLNKMNFIVNTSTAMVIDNASNVGIGTTGPDAKLDSLSTTEQLRLTYTDGSVYSSNTVDASGNLTIDNTGTKTIVADDLQITGDDLFMNTNTSGYMLVADGTNYNPVAISGDITIGSTGVTAIGANRITESMLKSVNGPTDEMCLTYESTVGDFEWQTCGSSSGGSNWRISSGAISPNNDTLDLLVGGIATASAKFSVNASNGNVTSAGSITSGLVATYDPISISPIVKGANPFTGTITSLDLTSARTWTLPNNSGTIALSSDIPASSWTDAGTYLYPAAGEVLGNATTGGANKIAGIYLADSAPMVFGNDNDISFSFSGSTLGSTLASGTRIGIGTTTGLATLDIRGSLGTIPVASISGDTAMASLIVDQSGIGDIFTASKSGDTKFVITNAGNVGIGVADAVSKLHLHGAITGKALAIFNELGDQDIFTASSSSTTRFRLTNDGSLSLDGDYLNFGLTTGTSGYGFRDNAGVMEYKNSAGAWAGIGSGGGGASWWDQTAGTLQPYNKTVDFLLGGTATSSAKFAVLNMNSGTPTASISGNLIIGNTGYIGSQYGALNLAYKSAADTWTTGLILDDLTGNVGIGVSAPAEKLEVNGYIVGQRFVDSAGAGAFYIDPAATGTSISIEGNIVGNGGFSISTGSDATAVQIGTTGNGKLDAGTIDPPYTINGEKFATYMSGMTGVKEETTGVIHATEYVPSIGYRATLDLATTETGSDLWLFGKASNLKSNLDKLVVLLASSSNTKTWYDIDALSGKLYLYSLSPTTISYRLTAPRYDASTWANTRDESSTSVGHVVNDDNTWSVSSAIADLFAQSDSAPVSPLSSDQPVAITAPVTISANNGPVADLTVDGELEAGTISARTAILANIEAETITAKNIVADTIEANHIIGLDAKIASLSAGMTDSEFETITDRIKARLGELTGDVPTAQDIPTPTASNGSELPAVCSIAQDSSEPCFSPDPNIATTSATLSSADIDFATINNYLAVIGQATITTLDVTNGLYVDSIDSKSGRIALAGGTLTVDSSGTVAINGDLVVSGKILADSAELNSLSLGTPSASESALGKLLSIYNEQGEAVATIDASGSANLASLTTNMITIASAPSATQSALAELLGTAESNATAGESVLISPNTEIVIHSPYVTSNSLVYLTPTGNTEGKVLFVKSKESCNSQLDDAVIDSQACTPSFTVGIDLPTSSDISFNWWIIQLGTSVPN